ncbi:MAG TPA: MFS transporter [Patescibacteria group bacterium]|nr:MFS transporter [Patescibacteria group bacterium]
MNQSIFLAFREKSFLFLWIGEVLTQISINLFLFYLILSVFGLTKSNTAVAIVIITCNAPAIIFGVLAGVYVDHWSKKQVLIWTNIFRALFIFILAFIHTDLVIIYIISLIIAFISQFFIPAENPLIPLIVQKENLYSANALFVLANYGSVLVAYMLSGTIILFFGEQGTLFVLTFLLLVSSVSIFFVRYRIEEKYKENVRMTLKVNIRHEIKAALNVVRKTKEISSSLFLLALSPILILLIAAVAPGYATQVLGMDVEKFPITFVTPAAIGMLLGAVILANRFQNIAKEKMVIAGLFISGLSLLILPYGSIISSKEFVQDFNLFLPHILMITSLHVLVVLAFFLGLANSLVFVPSNTILQENTTDENRGKIYGLLSSIVGLFSLVPLIAVGGLSDLIGVSHVITGMGICVLLIGIYQVYAHKIGYSQSIN